jgi:site-specific recombinase XerD
MEPRKAVENYTETQKHSKAKSTVSNYEYRLERFLEFAEKYEIEEMEQVTGRVVEQYKKDRIDSGEVNPVTLEQQLRTFRQFLRWCESNELVEHGVAEHMLIPGTQKEERVRHNAMNPDRAEEILKHQERFNYASRQHVVFYLLWNTGMRGGSLRALDVDDWHSEKEFLSVRHRPETDTPLKLKEGGERNITITDEELRDVLDDWIEHNRPPVKSAGGREPLIATSNGRAAKGTIRSDVYRVVQPCRYSNECPHGREINDCEARKHDHMFECPSSIYPHAIRSGAITEHLNDDVPKEIVSERTNVSKDILDEHYDERSLEERRERRKKYL